MRGNETGKSGELRERRAEGERERESERREKVGSVIARAAHHRHRRGNCPEVTFCWREYLRKRLAKKIERKRQNEKCRGWAR